jgi:hypothetical protein
VVAAVALMSVAASFAQEAPDRPLPAPQTRVFNVRDLILPVPNYSVSPLNLQCTSGSRGRTGAGSSIFADTSELGRDWGESGKSLEESMMDLIDFFQCTIEPGTWDEGSGNAIRGRQGMLVVTHQAEVIEKIKSVLDQLRTEACGKMVSVHVTIVRPKPEDLKQILERKLFLAATPEARAELRKLGGEIVAEARTLCLDGQRVYTEASREQSYVENVTTTTVSEKKDGTSQADQAAEVGAVKDGLVVDVRPMLAEDGSVLLDLRGSLAYLIAMETNPAAGPPGVVPAKPVVQLPRVAALVFQGQYRIPNGALLFASGGPLLDKDPKGVFALVQIDVVEGAPARGK